MTPNWNRLERERQRAAQELHDSQVSEETESPELTDEEKVEAIKAKLRMLSYREREILKLRYGLGDGMRYTLEEVGYIFKVNRERIRQIEKKAKAKLGDLVDEEFLARVFGKLTE